MKINCNVDDAQEPIVVDAGTEVTLRITAVAEGTNKNGNTYIMPRFEVENEPYCKDFSKYMELPHDEMTEKQRNKALWALKELCQCFDISLDDDTEDWQGATGDAILGVSSDQEYGEQNFVKTFIIPR
jgi:hypothetical protein